MLLRPLIQCTFLFSSFCNALETLRVFKNIVSGFRPSSFNVKGVLQKNPHYQTIVGSEVIRTKLFGEYPRKFQTRTERWITNDGDFIDLEFTKENSNSKSIVIILHGLESSPKSPLVTKMATAFLNRGFQCCLLSFRGCSGEDNKVIGAYHLGFTDDINFVSRRIHKLHPDKNIYFSGFSLGGNAILKYLGELGDEAPKHRVLGATVTCVPFDPVASQVKLDAEGFSRSIYSEVSYISDRNAR